jgi:hypothetical protein
LSPTFYVWALRCCQILGWGSERVKELMPEYGTVWWGYYCGGLTPEEAVKRYQGP